MASIDSYLEAILEATYGNQVRGSIHDALKAMNTESGTAASAATSAQTTANTALTNVALAQSTANNAASAASAAQTTADTAVTNAATAQGAAESAATAAQAAQTTANTAVTNAATAQTTANNAAAAAQAAQTTANTAATNAATAQTTADNAATAAATAQGTAATATVRAATAIDSSVSRAFDVPAETRAANVFHGINESITRRTLTVSPFGWSSVWLSGTVPASGSTYSQLMPFAYTFNAGQTYTIYVTGQSEITGLMVRPFGADYVRQGGKTVSGIVNGGAVNFVPDSTITVNYINLWHGAGLVAEDTTVAGELVIMIVPGAYTTNDFTVGDAVEGVPRYWNPALDTAIAKIQALDGETGTHGDSFVFVTDYHIQKNANRSATLIKEIVASTAVDKVFYGGDTLDEQTAKAQAYVLHRKFWRQFDGMRVFPIYGNHDNNDNHRQTDEDILTYNEVYSLFGKRVEKYGINTTISPDTHDEDSLITGTETTWRERWGHTEPLGNYYYFDNTPQKIRYIVLNGFFAVKAGDQGTWFRNTLNATPAGWTIVVLCHAWWQDAARTKYTATTGSLKNALDAYIKGGGAAKVACWIAGHLHYDYSEMIDTVVTSGDDAGKTYSFPVIITTCDSYLNDTTNMTLGTATEQAFDVVHVDTYNQTVKCTRVGAGSDRLSYTYGFNA